LRRSCAPRWPLLGRTAELRNEHPAGRQLPPLAVLQIRGHSSRTPLKHHAPRRRRSSVGRCRLALVGAHQLPRVLRDVSAVDLVIERMEPSSGQRSPRVAPSVFGWRFRGCRGPALPSPYTLLSCRAWAARPVELLPRAPGACCATRLRLTPSGRGVLCRRLCARPARASANIKGIVPTRAGPGRGLCDARDRVHAKGITRPAGPELWKQSRQTGAGWLGTRLRSTRTDRVYGRAATIDPGPRGSADAYGSDSAADTAGLEQFGSCFAGAEQPSARCGETIEVVEVVPPVVEIHGDGRSELNGYIVSAAISSSADV
jgi:hypothetical protein